LSGVTIPGSVTNIEDHVFQDCFSLASVTISNGITSIADWVFSNCYVLTNVTLPSGITNIGQGSFSSCYILTNFTVPSRLVHIGSSGFSGCNHLSSLTFPGSVTKIDSGAFVACYSLRSVYFMGNAPSVASDVFFHGTNIVYYLPGTTNWGPTLAGRPAVLWNPSIQTTDGHFGVQTNRFGFTITGTTNIPVAVEASTNLASASWTALQTCTLTNGSIYFSDPDWTNYPARLYRIRSP
jgi:hypothetical protein